MAGPQSSLAPLVMAIAMGLLPLVFGIVAIATGVAARRQIARSGGALRGGGMALTGIVLGSLTLFASLGLATLSGFVALSQRKMEAHRAALQAAERAAAMQAAQAATRTVAPPPTPVPVAPPAPAEDER